MLGKKAKKPKEATSKGAEPDLKDVASKAIDKAMKDAAKGRTQQPEAPPEDTPAAVGEPEPEMEVIEVVLRGGSGYTIRALDDTEDEPLLARDGKLVMFPSLRDLVDFVAEGGPHSLSGRETWAGLAAQAAAGGLVAELLDSYDLTEVAELCDGTAEDRWTAGLLVGYAIDAADSVGCPPLEALNPDSALLTLEREPAALEAGKHAATLREKLLVECRTVWPKVLRELEDRSVWWTVVGTTGAPAAERRKQEEAMRLARAEAAVAVLHDEITEEPAFVIPTRTPAGKTLTPAAAQEKPPAEPYDWDAVGAFPIEIRLPRGSGITLVSYPDDGSTEFLGGRGHLLLFGHRRGLLAYLRQTPDHSLAHLPGWAGAPPLDPAALEPTGYYYLHDVPDRLLKGLDREGAEEVADAFLLAADMATQLGNPAVLGTVDPDGPLARFMDALSTGSLGTPVVSAFGVQKAEPLPTPPEAAAMWRRMTRRLDDSVTFLT